MKASFRLQNGTNVEIDGDPEDVQTLLAHFSSPGHAVTQSVKPRKIDATRRKSTTVEPAGASVSEIEVVNWIKEQGSAPWIDEILDSRDVTRRVLLPLYVSEKLRPGVGGITSGFISRVLTQLGVKISIPNVSTELSGKANRLVLAGSVRRRGAPVNYRISRAGVALLEQASHG
jgi:hypothetical protein